MMSDLSKWYQNAYLYEYIVGRVIILFNIEYFLDNPKISQIFTDRTYLFDVENDCTDILSILNEVNDFGKPNNQILNEIFNNSIGIHSTGIENENVCGNMIMQYFALDPMEIETHNQVTELYGGNYKKKYLKYKQKYLELKNKI